MTVETVLARHTFSSNCYLVASEKGNCAVIDPGAEGEGIIAVLEERGWTPRMILLTHGHYDHVGAVKALQRHYENLPVSIHKGDLSMVSEGGWNGRERVLSIDSFLSEGLTITLDELVFTVMETPGHSEGSVCIACGDYLFTGDTLFHEDVGRTDLPGGSAKKLYGSILRLSKLEQNYLIYPGHEETGSILEEQEFFREFLASAP